MTDEPENRGAMTTTTLRSISYGGGVQSTALLVLAAQGRIVADWYASSEGRDVLYDELAAAGFQLPDTDR